MDKLKFIFIFCIGFLTLLYNILNNNLIDLFRDTELLIFLQGQISTTVSDSFFGALFDYVIGILFNINIRDVNSYLRMFGG